MSSVFASFAFTRHNITVVVKWTKNCTSETFELLLAEFVHATSVLYFDDVSSEKLQAVISIGGGGTLTNTLGIKKFL